MSSGIGSGNANPLDVGASPNSVETAAESFTELLRDENSTDRQANSPRKSGRRERGDEGPERLFEDTRNPEIPAPDAARSDGGQARKPKQAPQPEEAGDEDDAIFSDPFLTGEVEKAEQDKDGEGEEGEDDGEAEGEEDEHKVDAGDLDLDQEVEVTVNGEPVTVKLSEALQGYSRDADYRQKTQRLSEERQELFAYAEEVVEERKRYSETLDNWITMTAALEPSKAEWDQLETENPKLFIATQKQWQAIRAKADEAKAEKAKVTEAEQREAVRRYSQYVNEQNGELLKAVPALRDAKKAETFRKFIYSYGKRAGYSDEEISRGAVNHRDILTLYKAARFDEIQRSRKAGARNGKGRQEPQNSSSTRPRNVSLPQRQPAQNKALQDADRRLQRTGSVDAAASAFTQMILNENRRKAR